MGNRMSALVILGDTSGSITLQAPAAAGSGTVYTLPAATGTVMVSGNMPLFRVFPSTIQTINHNTLTKINWGSETYDTANCFASDKFTPNVAGYYQLNILIDMGITNGRNYYFQPKIYKNGSLFANAEPEWYATGNSSQRTNTSWADIVYLNGSSDYVEIYLYAYDYTASSTVTVRGESSFSGCLVRAA